jgi:hypothetical protein
MVEGRMGSDVQEAVVCAKIWQTVEMKCGGMVDVGAAQG